MDKMTRRKFVTFFLAALAALLLLSELAFSQIVSTTGGSWTTPATWAGGVVPGATDDVVIRHAVSINSTTAITVNNLTLDGQNGFSATLTVNSSAATTELIVNGTFTAQAASGTPGSAKMTIGLNAAVSIAGSVSILRNYPSSVSIDNVGLELLGQATLTVGGDFTIESRSGNKGTGSAARELRLNRGTLTIAGDFSLLQTGGSREIYTEVFSTSSPLFSTISCRDFVCRNTTGAGITLNCRQGSFINASRNLTIDNQGSGNISFGLGLTGSSGSLNVTGNMSLTTTSSGDISFPVVESSSVDIDGNLSISDNGTNISISFANTSQFELGGSITPTTLNADNLIFANTSYALFNGTALQTIPGQTTGTESFPQLELDNSAGANLTGNLNISTQLNFTNGRVFGSGRTITLAGNLTGSSTSYLCGGTLVRTLSAGAGPFWFHLGDEDFGYSPVVLTNLSSASNFEVSYIVRTSHSTPYSIFQTDGTPVVSGHEYWMINRLAGTGSANVTLGWNSFSDVNGAALSDLRVMRWNGTQWTTQGAATATGTSTAGTVSTDALVSNFSPFTIGSTTLNNPLPVTLESFNAARKANGVELRWRTLSELDNAHYEIRRSSDGLYFFKIGEVEGHGTTTSAHDYSFMDPAPGSCLLYYQLRQVDYSGQSELSEMVKVDAHHSQHLEVYPNPITDPQSTGIHLPLCADGTLLLTITDLFGKTCYSVEINANDINDTFQNLIALLDRGQYVISLNINQKIHHARFLKF